MLRIKQFYSNKQNFSNRTLTYGTQYSNIKIRYYNIFIMLGFEFMTSGMKIYHTDFEKNVLINSVSVIQNVPLQQKYIDLNCFLSNQNQAFFRIRRIIMTVTYYIEFKIPLGHNYGPTTNHQWIFLETPLTRKQRTRKQIEISMS